MDPVDDTPDGLDTLRKLQKGVPPGNALIANRHAGVAEERSRSPYTRIPCIPSQEGEQDYYETFRLGRSMCTVNVETVVDPYVFETGGAPGARSDPFPDTVAGDALKGHVRHTLTEAYAHNIPSSKDTFVKQMVTRAYPEHQGAASAVSAHVVDAEEDEFDKYGMFVRAAYRTTAKVIAASPIRGLEAKHAVGVGDRTGCWGMGVVDMDAGSNSSEDDSTPMDESGGPADAESEMDESGATEVRGVAQKGKYAAAVNPTHKGDMDEDLYNDIYAAATSNKDMVEYLAASEKEVLAGITSRLGKANKGALHVKAFAAALGRSARLVDPEKRAPAWDAGVHVWTENPATKERVVRLADVMTASRDERDFEEDAGQEKSSGTSMVVYRYASENEVSKAGMAGASIEALPSPEVGELANVFVKNRRKWHTFDVKRVQCKGYARGDVGCALEGRVCAMCALHKRGRGTGPCTQSHQTRIVTASTDIQLEVEPTEDSIQDGTFAGTVSDADTRATLEKDANVDMAKKFLLVTLGKPVDGAATQAGGSAHLVGLVGEGDIAQALRRGESAEEFDLSAIVGSLRARADATRCAQAQLRRCAIALVSTEGRWSTEVAVSAYGTSSDPCMLGMHCSRGVGFAGANGTMVEYAASVLSHPYAKKTHGSSPVVLRQTTYSAGNQEMLVELSLSGVAEAPEYVGGLPPLLYRVKATKGSGGTIQCAFMHPKSSEKAMQPAPPSREGIDTAAKVITHFVDSILLKIEVAFSKDALSTPQGMALALAVAPFVTEVSGSGKYTRDDNAIEDCERTLSEKEHAACVVAYTKGTPTPESVSAFEKIQAYAMQACITVALSDSQDNMTEFGVPVCAAWGPTVVSAVEVKGRGSVHPFTVLRTNKFRSRYTSLCRVVARASTSDARNVFMVLATMGPLVNWSPGGTAHMGVHPIAPHVLEVAYDRVIVDVGEMSIPEIRSVMHSAGVDPIAFRGFLGTVIGLWNSYRPPIGDSGKGAPSKGSRPSDESAQSQHAFTEDTVHQYRCAAMVALCDAVLSAHGMVGVIRIAKREETSKKPKKRKAGGDANPDAKKRKRQGKKLPFGTNGKRANDGSLDGAPASKKSKSTYTEYPPPATYAAALKGANEVRPVTGFAQETVMFGTTSLADVLARKLPKQDKPYAQSFIMWVRTYTGSSFRAINMCTVAAKSMSTMLGDNLLDNVLRDVFDYVEEMVGDDKTKGAVARALSGVGIASMDNGSRMEGFKAASSVWRLLDNAAQLPTVASRERLVSMLYPLPNFGWSMAQSYPWVRIEHLPVVDRVAKVAFNAMRENAGSDALAANAMKMVSEDVGFNERYKDVGKKAKVLQAALVVVVQQIAGTLASALASMGLGEMLSAETADAFCSVMLDMISTTGPTSDFHTVPTILSTLLDFNSADIGVVLARTTMAVGRALNTRDAQKGVEDLNLPNTRGVAGYLVAVYLVVLLKCGAAKEIDLKFNGRATATSKDVDYLATLQEVFGTLIRGASTLKSTFSRGERHRPSGIPASDVANASSSFASAVMHAMDVVEVARKVQHPAIHRVVIGIFLEMERAYAKAASEKDGGPVYTGEADAKVLVASFLFESKDSFIAIVQGIGKEYPGEGTGKYVPIKGIAGTLFRGLSAGYHPLCPVLSRNIIMAHAETVQPVVDEKSEANAAVARNARELTAAWASLVVATSTGGAKDVTPTIDKSTKQRYADVARSWWKIQSAMAVRASALPAIEYLTAVFKAVAQRVWDSFAFRLEQQGGVSDAIKSAWRMANRTMPLTAADTLAVPDLQITAEDGLRPGHFAFQRRVRHKQTSSKINAMLKNKTEEEQERLTTKLFRRSKQLQDVVTVLGNIKAAVATKYDYVGILGGDYIPEKELTKAYTAFFDATDKMRLDGKYDAVGGLGWDLFWTYRNEDIGNDPLFAAEKDAFLEDGYKGAVTHMHYALNNYEKYKEDVEEHIADYLRTNYTSDQPIATKNDSSGNDKSSPSNRAPLAILESLEAMKDFYDKIAAPMKKKSPSTIPTLRLAIRAAADAFHSMEKTTSLSEVLLARFSEATETQMYALGNYRALLDSEMGDTNATLLMLDLESDTVMEKVRVKTLDGTNRNVLAIDRISKTQKTMNSIAVELQYAAVKIDLDKFAGAYDEMYGGKNKKESMFDTPIGSETQSPYRRDTAHVMRVLRWYVDLVAYRDSVLTPANVVRTYGSADHSNPNEALANMEADVDNDDNVHGETITAPPRRMNREASTGKSSDDILDNLSLMRTPAVDALNPPSNSAIVATMLDAFKAAEGENIFGPKKMQYNSINLRSPWLTLRGELDSMLNWEAYPAGSGPSASAIDGVYVQRESGAYSVPTVLAGPHGAGVFGSLTMEPTIGSLIDSTVYNTGSAMAYSAFEDPVSMVYRKDQLDKTEYAHMGKIFKSARAGMTCRKALHVPSSIQVEPALDGNAPGTLVANPVPFAPNDSVDISPTTNDPLSRMYAAGCRHILASMGATPTSQEVDLAEPIKFTL